MSEVLCDVNLVEICAVLGLGRPKGAPRRVSGGLIHRVWHLRTDTGQFALKVLNEEIMARPEAKVNYRNAERIAHIARSNGIAAVVARMLRGDPLIEVSDRLVMVFDWVEGRTLPPTECRPEHAKKIGELLFQLHDLDIEVANFELPVVSSVPSETWTSHVRRAEKFLPGWGFTSESLLYDVLHWSREYELAAERLRGTSVISHRDVDTKNVIWTEEHTPNLIDWESAGYVHPTVELMQSALDWSLNEDGTHHRERFQTLLHSYLTAGGSLNGRPVDALNGTLGGTLGWLEYNMRRSLDEDLFSCAEKQLRQREVRRTVQQLKLLNEATDEHVNWVEEVFNHQ